MTINEGKTEVKYPGKKSSRHKIVKIGGAKVKQKVRYLGIDMDKKAR